MRFLRSIRFWAVVLLAPFSVFWVLFALIYSFTPAYEDHIEPAVVVVAQQWMHGWPMYHSVDFPYQYSILYGPFGYIWLAFVLNLFSDPILASKLSGGFWSLSSLALLIYIYRARAGWAIALAGTGVVACELFNYNVLWPVFLWDRPDPILLFSTCLGLSALMVRRHRLGMFLLASAIAMATDCKIHGFLYLLPACTIWLNRAGWRDALLLLALACALVAVPFLLPGISLGSYLIRLWLSAAQGMTRELFCDNAEAFFSMLIPLAFVSARRRFRFTWRKENEDSLMFFALVLAGFLICFPASKSGAGTTHFMPLFPYVGYLFCSGLAALPDRPGLKWLLCLGVVWIFAGYQKAVRTYISVESLDANAAEIVQQDLRQILRVYPAAKVQMGVAAQGGYFATYYAPWIYQEGTPCVIDIGSYMEMKEAGLGPELLKRSFASGEFQYWLIPRDGPPFSIRSWFTETPLFDDSVAQTFLLHYTKVQSSGCFDIYEFKNSLP